MHARVTRLEGAPEDIEASTAYLRDTIIPQARAIEGFRGILSLTDRAGARALTVTFWESEDAMRVSEEAATTLRDEAARALSATVVDVDRYEVTVDERS